MSIAVGVRRALEPQQWWREVGLMLCLVFGYSGKGKKT